MEPRSGIIFCLNRPASRPPDHLNFLPEGKAPHVSTFTWCILGVVRVTKRYLEGVWKVSVCVWRVYTTELRKLKIDMKQNLQKIRWSKVFGAFVYIISHPKTFWYHIFDQHIFATLGSILDSQLSWESGKFQLARWSHKVAILCSWNYLTT